jgi:hypothetical protein
MQWIPPQMTGSPGRRVVMSGHLARDIHGNGEHGKSGDVGT